MQLDYRYSISLRLTHPTDMLEEASSIFGVNPSNSWVAGSPRRTPCGEQLSGVRKENFWTARLMDGRSQEQGLPSVLEQTVLRLEKGKKFLEEVSRSGGRAELFIGWFFDQGNSGDTLPYELLSALAGLKIDLSFDVYGDPEKPASDAQNV